MNTAVVCKKGYFKWLGFFFLLETALAYIFSIIFTLILFLHLIYVPKFAHVKLLAVETQSCVKHRCKTCRDRCKTGQAENIDFYRY